jgi:hypothetical protein
MNGFKFIIADSKYFTTFWNVLVYFHQNLHVILYDLFPTSNLSSRYQMIASLLLIPHD